MKGKSMGTLENSSNALLAELEALSSGPPQVSEEEYRQAEREINAHMEKYDLEWRAYMAQSIESAKHAYITW